MMMMRRQTNANAYDGNIYIYIYFRCFFCRAKLWQKITKTEVLQLHLSRMRSTWWKFFRWSVNFCDNCFGQRWEQRMGEQEEYNEKDFIWRKSVFFSLSHSIDKFFFPDIESYHFYWNSLADIECWPETVSVQCVCSGAEEWNETPTRIDRFWMKELVSIKLNMQTSKKSINRLSDDFRLRQVEKRKTEVKAPALQTFKRKLSLPNSLSNASHSLHSLIHFYS